MKILSLTQPFATLIALSYKRIETRSWRSSYRGEIAIHAAKGLTPIGGMRGFLSLCTEVEQFHRVLSEHMQTIESPTLNSYLDEIPMGGITCVVDFAACLSTNGGFMQMTIGKLEVVNNNVTEGTLHQVDYRKPAPYSDEYAFGNYDPDRWMWFFENIRKLKEPVPCKGARGLRDLDPKIEAKVRAQL